MKKSKINFTFGSLNFKFILVLALVVMVVLTATPAQAGGRVPVTRNLASSADSWLDEANINTNYGTTTTMTVRSAAPGVGKNARAVIKFDLSSIPTGSTISSANISVYAASVPGATRTYDAHRITTNWAETTVLWKAGFPWITAGGDYVAATGSCDTPALAGLMSFTVTSDVAAFVAGTYSNYGWLIKDRTESSSTAYATNFNTKEAGTNQPQLAVTYTAPWDSYASDYTTSKETYSVYGEYIYMKGTGFAAGTYTVKYYDNIGTEIGSEAKTIGAGEELRSSMPCNQNESAAGGTWRAKAYSNTTVIAEDTFTVNQSAIPEFPTVIAAITVAGLCCMIYYWMRKRVYRVRGVY